MKDPVVVFLNELQAAGATQNELPANTGWWNNWKGFGLQVDEGFHLFQHQTGTGILIKCIEEDGKVDFDMRSTRYFAEDFMEIIGAQALALYILNSYPSLVSSFQEDRLVEKLEFSDAVAIDERAEQAQSNQLTSLFADLEARDKAQQVHPDNVQPTGWWSEWHWTVPYLFVKHNSGAVVEVIRVDKSSFEFVASIKSNIPISANEAWKLRVQAISLYLYTKGLIDIEDIHRVSIKPGGSNSFH